MKTKDFIVLAIAILVFLPTLLIVNENMEEWWINLLGLAYIGLLAWATKTKIGKMFWARLERIEDKLFGKIGG